MAVNGEGYAANLASIKEARLRIHPFANVTPVLTSRTLDEVAGRKLFFKCENFQKVGAFKFRGACNAVFSLPEHIAKKGVVTHSSGNHAAALALAAKLRDIPAHVVIPRDAPACKVANVERYGGEIIFCEPTLQAREETCKKIQDQTDAVMIHPFNNNAVISGQGTLGAELLEQVPELDAIFVPISGGGLISGITLAAKALKPSIKIFAAEPKGADDAARSKAEGKMVTNTHTDTIADGLLAVLGDLTWPVVRDLVEEVITVSEAEIVQAMKLCFNVLKVVIEPSSAVGLAAILSSQFQNNSLHSECKTVGVILSGGNIDLDSFWKIYDREDKN